VQHLRKHLPPHGGDVKVLIYDNSPNRWDGAFEAGWVYHHDPSNGGIAAAYNTAFHMAQGSAEWLLLLDQDSSLSEDFLEKLFVARDRCGQDHQVAAVVPRIYTGGVLISPWQVKLGRRIRERDTGLRPYEITALNSGSMVRVGFLAQLGGFNPVFWLDFLDYWLYHQIHTHGYRVFVSQASMTHNLSLLSDNYVGRERYENILAAETTFTNCYRPRLEQMLYPIRLLLRSVEQALSMNKRHVALSTLAETARQLKFLFTGFYP